MIISMPKVLLDKLGSDGADALVHVLNDAESKTRTDLATKSDLMELKLSTKADLSEAKTDILKWIVLLWVAQIGATVALFFKK